MRRRVLWTLLVLAALTALFAATVAWLNVRGEEALPGAPVAFEATPQRVERGRYLALAGNCATCHTTRGGAPYAGGVVIDTPFGAVVAGNLTPDKAHGIGTWSAAEFWRAMHHGRSKDGRLLYPAFPYPSFTRLTREDSDAIYAYLQQAVPASARPNDAHRLRFPYDTQAALAVWRAFSFRPATFVARADQPAEWNRGAYLVDGLGHCIACHGARNTLGATQEARGLSGGSLLVEGWYAPSLTSTREAGVADWSTQDIVALLQTGTSARGSVMGPMADVVYRSTQHLNDADLRAMARYLQQLPTDGDHGKAAAPGEATAEASGRRDESLMLRGQKIYDQRCAYCHGDQGQGQAGAFPPLAGNRAVLMDSPVNLIQIVRRGGFLPSTRGNPRPHGMPPFAQVLDDNDVGAVLSFVRGSWGNDAPVLTARDMLRR